MAEKREYKAAAHAMQSGVAAKMNYDSMDTTPKHLRVGVNAAMADHSGLVKLLMDKGLITHDEYIAAITEAMNREVESYEKELTEHFGKPIALA